MPEPKKNIKDPLNMLQRKLKKNKNKKILFFCIGNILKGDDGVGEYIYKKLNAGRDIYKINAGNAPVNYIGKVESISPDIVFLIDCINSNDKPGSILFTKFSKVFTSIIDTHSGLIHEYIKLIKPAPEWYILGIQPYTLEGINEISAIVKKVADRIIKLLNTSFN